MKQVAIVVLKRAGWALLGLLGAFLILLLAWAASNNRWVDAAPQPRPEQLQIKPATLAPERNAFFTLSKLHAVAGSAPSLPRLSGGLWSCDTAACVTKWLAEPEALRKLLISHEEIGRRCDALMSSFAFEEVMPSNGLPDQSRTYWIHLQGALDCARWFQAQAVLSASRGELTATLQSLEQSDRLCRGVLAGSRSTVSHIVSWSQLRRQWQTVAELGAHRPQWADQLLPLLRPLEPASLPSRHWIAFESSLTYSAIEQLSSECKKSRLPELDNWADRLFCEFGIGILTQETLQESDRYWLTMLETMGQAPLTPEDSPNWYSSLAWRNSIGHLLLAIARPLYPSYLAQQADVELHRRAANFALQLAAERVPTAQRAARLVAQQTVDHGERLTLAEDELQARPWLAEMKSRLEPRDAIRIPLARF